MHGSGWAKAVIAKAASATNRRRLQTKMAAIANRDPRIAARLMVRRRPEGWR